jgi:DNA end-binding protein Ku
VFHNREYLVAVRPLDEVLALQTMRFAAELVDAESLDIPQPSRVPTRREVDMAGTLVESLYEEFRPESFQDTYRELVMDLIRTKARGEEPDLPEPAETDGGLDLAAALEASLGSRAKATTKRSTEPSSKPRPKTKTKAESKRKSKARR